MGKKKILKIALVVLLVVGLAGFLVNSNILTTRAEQSGSSPESGATSRLKTTYDQLVALGTNFGTDSDSPDWGAMWNRIKTAAKWVPNGTAAAGDVVSGKTFFNTTRTAVTGTYSTTNLTPSNVVAGVTYGVGETGTRAVVGPCSTQLYEDSHGAPVTFGNSCSFTWTAASPGVTGDDATGYDPATGLKWSKCLQNSSGTVVFVTSSCTGWSWDASGAANVAVGNKTAIQLCSERGNGWRLPTQKEVLQAYIDGVFFALTQTSIYYWSATNNQDSTRAWLTLFDQGASVSAGATGSGNTRCVR